MNAASAACAARIDGHRESAAELRATSDEGLLDRLSGTGVCEHGQAVIPVGDGSAKVFVKLVPLTAVEALPENRHTTANLFDLPPVYQYRLGGLGFGAWRELAVHVRANEWITSGGCARFPLLHDWRVLPVAAPRSDDMMDPTHWGHHPAITRRIAATAAATSSIVLFLEYFPATLLDWLQGPLAAGLETESRRAEQALSEAIGFLHERGVLHMDAHLENVLTDGHEIVLTDFGLATSQAFPLDAGEQRFFARHTNFDRCTVLTSLVHAIVSPLGPPDQWRATLRRVVDEGDACGTDLSEEFRSYVTARAPIALAKGEFYRDLLADLTTPYPAERLDALLAAVR